MPMFETEPDIVQILNFELINWNPGLKTKQRIKQIDICLGVNRNGSEDKIQLLCFLFTNTCVENIIKFLKA